MNSIGEIRAEFKGNRDFAYFLAERLKAVGVRRVGMRYLEAEAWAAENLDVMDPLITHTVAKLRYDSKVFHAVSFMVGDFA